jgi:hypothetical protein
MLHDEMITNAAGRMGDGFSGETADLAHLDPGNNYSNPRGTRDRM